MCKSVRLWHTAAVSNSPPIYSQPRWRLPSRMLLADLPAAVKPWLLDEASLTERLVRKSGGHFRVQRLRQDWRRPLLSEARLLGLPPGQWAMVREVVLHCFDEPWVYARSVIPADALTGRLRRLRRLQNESLGALLFQNPQLTREAFEVTCLPGRSHYIHPDLRQSEPAWARRSCFRLYGHSLLVSEVFLERFQA